MKGRIDAHAYSMCAPALQWGIRGNWLGGDRLRLGGVDVLQLIFLSRRRPNVGRLSRLSDRGEEIKLREMCRSAGMVGGDLGNTLWR